MAILELKNSKAYPTKVIKYIMRDDKCVCHDTILMMPDIPYYTQFTQTANLYNKYSTKEERKYYQAIISFDPKNNELNGGNMRPEDALEIAKELIEQTFPGHEAVISIHNDKPHIHAHVIVNAVNVDSGKSLNLRDRAVRAVKDLAYRLTTERGFYSMNWREATSKKRERTRNSEIVKTEEKNKSIEADKRRITNGKDAENRLSQKETTKWNFKNSIDTALYMSRDIKEFENNLSAMGIVLPRNTAKTISFKMVGVDYTLRGKTLGEEYTKASITNYFLKKEVPEWWGIATSNRVFTEKRMKEMSDIDKWIDTYAKEGNALFKEKNRLTERNEHAVIVHGLLTEYGTMQPSQKRAGEILGELEPYDIDPMKVSAEEIKKVMYSREVDINEIDKKLMDLSSKRMNLRKTKNDILNYGRTRDRGIVRDERDILER